MTNGCMVFQKAFLFTHGDRDKMADILQTTSSSAFFYWRYINFGWYFPEFCSKSQINNIPALAKIMAWCRLCDKPSTEPVMVCLLTHICVTRSQLVKQWHLGCMASSPFCKFTINSKLCERKERTVGNLNLLSPPYRSFPPIALRHSFCHAAFVKVLLRT